MIDSLRMQSEDVTTVQNLIATFSHELGTNEIMSKRMD